MVRIKDPAIVVLNSAHAVSEGHPGSEGVTLQSVAEATPTKSAAKQEEARIVEKANVKNESVLATVVNIEQRAHIYIEDATAIHISTRRGHPTCGRI